MYVLDTNVLSELRPGKKNQSDAVRAWAGGVPLGQQFVSVVSWLELELGVLGVARRDAAQGAALRNWFSALREAFAGRVLAVSEPVALQAARLHVPDRMPELDALIAASTMTHGMTLVTRNTRDFERCGVKLLDPWDAASG